LYSTVSHWLEYFSITESAAVPILQEQLIVWGWQSASLVPVNTALLRCDGM